MVTSPFPLAFCLVLVLVLVLFLSSSFLFLHSLSFSFSFTLFLSLFLPLTSPLFPGLHGVPQLTQPLRALHRWHRRMPACVAGRGEIERSSSPTLQSSLYYYYYYLFIDLFKLSYPQHCLLPQFHPTARGVHVEQHELTCPKGSPGCLGAALLVEILARMLGLYVLLDPIAFYNFILL